MAAQLAISLGQCSDRGNKPANQDFYGAVIPKPPLLAAKGIAIALADGISSSAVSAIAAETAVASFLDDYYCTAAAWDVQTAATRVINATNAWLHVQTRQGQRGAPDAHDPDRGYVCTFDALILLSATAHLFHVGDARIYRIDGASVEQLTEDHRVLVSSQQSYLGRALGVNHTVEIDYQVQPIQPGDVFILATDGVHTHIDPNDFPQAIHDSPEDLDAAAAAIVARALANGSPDNLTVQIVRIDATPPSAAPGKLPELPLPPPLEPGMLFDGYRILRTLHASSRSHVHLAIDTETEARVALKTPSVDLRDDPAYLRRLMTEEWVARRLDNPHILRAPPLLRPRNFLYAVAEYVEGQTLTQWMHDHPRPDLESVRGIVDQIAKGLRAFHRKAMLHQDLRPENILIDRLGTIRIIDFGSVRIGGDPSNALLENTHDILGTVQYTAPEYFIGEPGTPRSDLFSLGVITYQMLTGQLPYGAAIPMARNRAQQRRLVYRTAYTADRDIPSWIDATLEKAVAIDPSRRYDSLSAFMADLRQPNPDFTTPRPLLHRNPVLFWKLASIALALLSLFLAYRLSLH